MEILTYINRKVHTIAFHLEVSLRIKDEFTEHLTVSISYN